MKTSRLGFVLGALTGAALATLFFVLFRERPETSFSPYAIAPPEGGETDGEHELFVG